MNDEKKELLAEVTAFIKRAAPPGGIAWAKTTEPFATRIKTAQERIMTEAQIRAPLRDYATAFFTAFRVLVERRYPSPLDKATVSRMTRAEIWHAGKRLHGVLMDSELGPFLLTPRHTVQAPGEPPAFSAAELDLMDFLQSSERPMVEAGLIEPGVTQAAARVAMLVKQVFPGAQVSEITDALGERHTLLPRALS